MKFIRLTPENVRYYVGYEIIFKSRGKSIVKIILDISKSGKSIKIDHPDLQKITSQINIQDKKYTIIIY